MISDLLYSIGEATFLDIDEIENITYPRDTENPRELMIFMSDKKKYALKLTEVE
jgi:hypothetical protein